MTVAAFFSSLAVTEGAGGVFWDLGRRFNSYFIETSSKLINIVN